MMQKEQEILVEVQNVSKKFCKDLKTGLKYGAKDIFSEIVGVNSHKDTLRKQEFWAVKDVSFTLRRGECIGLIGHNGAGKSTLLKILNGLYAPDKGTIVMKGKISALIELGAGFNPILTGRENIYNNAAILGFTKKEVQDKIQDIIDFSEIEEFIDMPVKNYSSGMKVRLGFAVAAFLEPDILIIDEVLAVGDLSFRLKCFKKIDQLLPNTAIIFVSHAMTQVSRMCDQILLLDHGKIEYLGNDTAKGIELYYGKSDADETITVFDSKDVTLVDFEFINLDKKDVINWNNDLDIEITLKILNTNIKNYPFININIYDKEDRNVAVVKGIDFEEELSYNTLKYFIQIPNLQLSKGYYYFNLAVSKKYGNDPLLRMNYVRKLQVEDKREIWPAFYLNSQWQIK